MNNNWQFIDDRRATLAVNSNMIKSLYEGSYLEDCERKHYVLWSGGTDSTLLLYELLDAYGSDNVVAVSIKYPWLYSKKWETEKKHREAIKAKFALRGPKFEGFTHVEFTTKYENITGELRMDREANNGHPQAIGWMSMISIYMIRYSYLYIGAIRDDDLCIKYTEYHNMFENICKLLEREMTLREPYTFLTKQDILYKLFEYGIYDETWTCEMPTEINKVCGGCNPCILHKNALISLSDKDLYKLEISELIRLQAKDALNKFKNVEQDNTYISEESSIITTNTGDVEVQ